MGTEHGFLLTFALVLCTAAVTTVLFERLKQPVILGYLVAGMLVGPHVTLFPFIADVTTSETLAELGVILLLFSIGLEFSIRKLLRVGGSVAVTAIIEVSLMTWLGFTAARLLGFTEREALFTGAITAISSTTIIAKTFEDQRVARRLRDLVFGVLIVEDLVAVMFLAGLATLGGGADVVLWQTVLKLVILLIAWVMAGLLVVPRLMQFVVNLGRSETTLVASLGLCFAFALIALQLGYSVALGAFIAGSLIAESGKGHLVVELVRPVRDVFVAVFFVSVGMLIDPVLIARHWIVVVVLTLVVVIGKVVAVSSGAFLAGRGTQLSVRAGMSMAQIGEFSFIIASLGLTLGVVREFLYPVAVAVSALTTLITPFLGGAADRIASEVDRRLPKPLQTLATLYETWVESLASAATHVSAARTLRRTVAWLLIDAVLLLAVIIGASRVGPVFRQFLTDRFGMGTEIARIVLIAVLVVVSAPFLFGIFRMARSLANQLARMALPRISRLDHAAAPRRSLVVTLELAIVTLVGLPVLAISQPFVSSQRGVVILVVVLGAMSIAAWRSATNLQGHVSAGSEVLLAALGQQLPPMQMTAEYSAAASGTPDVDRFTTATHLLPGIGQPQRFVVEADHFGAGKSLAELSLRGRTGATVLAIARGDAGIPAPSKVEVLLPGDRLVMVGTDESIRKAKLILQRGEE